jgi:dynein light chain 1, axonemal
LVPTFATVQKFASSKVNCCRRLSLSTNNIEKISSLSGLDNLQVLSLGRNQIKKIENLDSVAETLEELWISYNLLERLVGQPPVPTFHNLRCQKVIPY